MVIKRLIHVCSNKNRKYTINKKIFRNKETVYICIYLSVMSIEHTYNSRFVQNRFKSVISNL